ncbi:hypothetical protein IE53DRAFT_390203 [Violaceomyces palustris]|uniref:Uncharacterized protein n=1 Tax=Violaceomyces palustris TaxID=1673888 RepID=A0ACD0NPE7_9BASI|nr:hypothetical protein IE53DRAFT_390203 [Violaceomyces palustris]
MSFPSEPSVERSVSQRSMASTASSSSSSSSKPSKPGPKVLSLEVNSVTSPITPRKTKRMSLGYIPSPTNVAVNDSTRSPSAPVDDRSGTPTPSSKALNLQAGRNPTSSTSNLELFDPSQSSSSSYSPSFSAPAAPLPSSNPSNSGHGNQPETGSVASGQDGDEDGGDDWLMSDDEVAEGSRGASGSALPSMAQRDTNKIGAQFHDSGYREGITAGKLGNLQGGFDQGFNEVGAPIGRAIGRLRGEVFAMISIYEPNLPPSSGVSTPDSVGSLDSEQASDKASPLGKGAKVLSRGVGARARGAPGRGRNLTPEGARVEIPRGAPPNPASLRDALSELRRLEEDLDKVELKDVAPPDYEALEHDREHAVEAGALNLLSGKFFNPDGTVRRETFQEEERRQGIIPGFRTRLAEIRSMLSLTGV